MHVHPLRTGYVSPPGDPSEAETFRILFGGVVMIRGSLLMGLRPMAPGGDRFDPDPVGLDHLSFGVASRDDLEQAVKLFDEHGGRPSGALRCSSSRPPSDQTARILRCRRVQR